MYFSNFREGLLRHARHTIFGTAAILSLVFSSGAASQTSLNLAKAVQLSLLHNPQLQLYPFERSRIEALQLQAGLRPTPIVTLTVENAFGSGAYDDLDASETTLGLGQVIELGEKRDQRIAVARASKSQLSIEYELSRLDVLAETSRRYYRVVALQSQAAVNEQRLAEERRALAVIANRINAGAAANADRSKLELRLARSVANAQQLENAHTLARIRLAAMWQGNPGFDHVTGDISVIPDLPNLPTLLQSIEQAPRLEQQLALLRLADTSAQLAQANGRNDVTLGLGVRHLEASNDQALVFSVSMPLSFDNPNRGRIAAAYADQHRSARESDITRVTLQLELRQIHQQLLNNHSRAQQVKDELLPRSLKLIEDTRRGYQLGQFSVLQWTDAQAERFALERELITLYSAIHLQLLELERITGEALADITTGDIS
jgi:cobalt-zinc-cadmium efflux system outer membrane protein